jgi:hypothetical protein
MSVIDYRQYLPGDEELINEGFNRAFGLNRSLAEWAWKFPSGPAGRLIVVAIGEHSGLLAHYGGVATLMKVGDRRLWAAQNVDSFSTPHARHGLATGRVYLQAVATFLDRFWVNGTYPVLYGFPGHRCTPLLVRSGYARYGPISLWTRSPTCSPKEDARLGRVVASSCDDDVADSLWKRCEDRYATAIVRDAQWLRRRFTSHPTRQYRHLVVFRQGIARAWMVLCQGQTAARLVDLVWDGDSAADLAALDAEAARFAQKNSSPQMALWLSGDQAAERVLTESGWTQCPHSAASIILKYTEDVDGQSAQQYYYTMADADWF